MGVSDTSGPSSREAPPGPNLTALAAFLGPVDTVGNRGAATEISAIKIAAPEMPTWVIDRAIQTFGGAGVSQDLPLAQLYAQARMLRIADGPDEVHKMALARQQLALYRARASGSTGAGSAVLITT